MIILIDRKYIYREKNISYNKNNRKTVIKQVYNCVI